MNKVLETTKSVVAEAKHVQINDAAMEKVCAEFSTKDTKTWIDAAPFTWQRGNDETELAFVIVLNALNFCYWGEQKWSMTHQGKKLDGAWGMIASLRRAMEEGIPILDPRYLETIQKDDVAHILREEHHIPLFEERCGILQEVGHQMGIKYNYRFSYVVAAANGDALQLVDLLTRDFPSYCDDAVYNGRRVYFHKRAQLAVGDLCYAFKGDGFGKFRSIEQLTAVADYKIPQVLRKLGILEYNASLAEKVDAKMEIPHKSPEEIEIRASQIWAIERMKRILQPRFSQLTARGIDSWLWLKGQQKSPDDKPYHRTRTIAY